MGVSPTIFITFLGNEKPYISWEFAFINIDFFCYTINL